jgi:hypothetical protein
MSHRGTSHQHKATLIINISPPTGRSLAQRNFDLK